MAIVERKATIYRICPFVAACQCGHRNRGLSIKQLRILVFAVEMVGSGVVSMQVALGFQASVEVVVAAAAATATTMMIMHFIRVRNINVCTLVDIIACKFIGQRVLSIAYYYR